MNAVSLVLNGQTTAQLALLPERQRASITSLPAHRASYGSLSTHGLKRPQPNRRTSRDSPGWYNTDGGMTLDDFAQRLNTRLSRFEQWQTRCAQSVVMALIGPTPVVLFVFNPVSILICIALVSRALFEVTLLVLLVMVMVGLFVLRG